MGTLRRPSATRGLLIICCIEAASLGYSGVRNKGVAGEVVVAGRGGRLTEGPSFGVASWRLYHGGRGQVPPVRGSVLAAIGWFDSGSEAPVGILEGDGVSFRREILKDDLRSRAWIVTTVFILVFLRR